MSKDESPPRGGPTVPATAAASATHVASIGPSTAYAPLAAPSVSGRVGAAIAAAASSGAAVAATEALGEAVDGIRRTVSGFRDRGESGSTETEIVSFGSATVDPADQVSVPLIACYHVRFSVYVSWLCMQYLSHLLHGYPLRVRFHVSRRAQSP